MIEIHTAIFACFMFPLRPPFHALVAYHMEEGGIPLNDVVGVYCKNDNLTIDIKAQVPSIWTKGCMLGNCVCII